VVAIGPGHYVPAVLPSPSIDWSSDRRSLRLLDQRALPERESFLELQALDDIIEAITSLAIRGAPAIGVGAAIGLVVSLRHAAGDDGARARAMLPAFAKRLAAARPTAVNLAWAIRRMTARGETASDNELLRALEDEANTIAREDREMCEAIGVHGLPLIADGARVLTHCNAGALATSGIGTALAPVYTASARGRHVAVFVGETRPLRQGARLTAWELTRASIGVTVLPDSAVASLLATGSVDIVIVGADRIAANGDVANKIGTYGIALAARANGVPFYVAAPWSTIDIATPDGSAIDIEHRGAVELSPLPEGAGSWNPAFDVTPRELITGFLTDRGLVLPPFTDTIHQHSVNTESIPSATP
jgi:methylthioribose-1-phosphate isomerase